MEFDTFRQRFFHSIEKSEEQIAWIEKVFQIAIYYLFEAPHKKIHSDLTLPQIEEVFSEISMPEALGSQDLVLKETVEKVLAHSVRLTNPKFVGHMTGATAIFSLGVEMLTAVLNQNLNKIETALSASFVERQTLAWLHRLVYNREDAFYKRTMHHPDGLLGTVTSGGTLGNMTALTVARNLALPGVEKLGVAGALRKLKKKRCVIFASKRVHYSVKKVASLLGFGTESVIEIPVDLFTNKISISELKKYVERERKTGAVIVAFIGVAGTTETGSIDNLEAIAREARRVGAWFHVDAAWGGAILLSEKHKSLLSGIEKADSVVMDGHKLFYLPLDHGAVVFKNAKALNAIRHHANYIIREGSVDLGQTSLEGSRRFNSLKLWFALKTFGKSGYENLIDHSFEMAQQAAAEIEAHPNFEVTSFPETNILTYRYVPEKWKRAVSDFSEHLREKNCVKKTTGARPKNATYKIGIQTKSFSFANQLLNQVNIDLQKQQRQHGKSFVSRTTLESVTPGFETVVLRILPFNPFTTVEILREILAEQSELGEQIFRALWSKSAAKAPKGDHHFFPPF